ncbi:MAG: hypothetical protein JO261_01825, partial [Alphaproteobacteria bacterium]|nr:hypothetical protein [Alphaproteobacteria bacterium]
DPARVADIEAYVQSHVPADARKPFLGDVASIRQNQRIAAVVLPELDAYMKNHPPH